MTATRKGRPRLNKGEKAKKGTANQTREKQYEDGTMKVVPLAEYPKAPNVLGKEGKRVWDILAKELKDQKLISVIDLLALTALCIEWELYIEHRIAQKDIKSYYELKGKDGAKSYQPHPVHYNGTNHLREFIRLCNEFGLSPASRARIGLSNQEHTRSKAADLLKRAV